MPTYEYQCGHCGRFQTAQPITEPALTVCPTCGQPVQRLISRNVGIIFKGSGFYCTDRRSNTCLGGSEEKGVKPAAAGDKTEAKIPEAKTGQGSCSTCRAGKTPEPAAGSTSS
jgi:putative FmdB family regulatory protein